MGIEIFVLTFKKKCIIKSGKMLKNEYLKYEIQVLHSLIPNTLAFYIF